MVWGWPQWTTYPDYRVKGHMDKDGKLEYTPVDPDLKPVIHKYTNVREIGRWGDMGGPERYYKFPENPAKGKVFLVNDTYIRVDGVDFVNIRADVGKYRVIEINTGYGMNRLITPKCEGYVFAPVSRWMRDGVATAEPLMSRCMTGKELLDAEKDHVFLRNVRYYKVPMDYTLWVEYSHAKDDFLDSFAKQRLMAFNRVLRKKREEENLRRHEKGEKYDYEDLMNSTYDPKKHTLKGVKL